MLWCLLVVSMKAYAVVLIGCVYEAYAVVLIGCVYESLCCGAYWLCQ